MKILSRGFRGKFIHLLKRAFHHGKLELYGKLAPLRQPSAFESLLDASVTKDWVVYAKRPFGGPEQVLKYLAPYTHRVAISNQRLIQLRDGQVSFQYKDYADGHKTKTMTLITCEFIRRFLIHTLPNSFFRIRYYGFLANRDRNQRLDHCRRLLRMPIPSPEESTEQADVLDPSPPVIPCPACGCGTLTIVDVVLPIRQQPPRRPYFLIHRLPTTLGFDTS